MFKFKSVTVACCVALSSGAVSAANDELSLSVAQALLDEGNASQGYNLLKADFDPRSRNPLEYRLLGLLSKATGRPREARRYFNRVIALSNEPSLVGEAKLELAQIAYQLGDKDTAKRHLHAVKGLKPPAAVGDNIDAFLAVIDTRELPRNYQMTASIGIVADANANAGPEVESVLMYGVPYTLSEDAKATSAAALKTGLGIRHSTSLDDDMRLQSSASVSWLNYEDLDLLDSVSVAASTGISIRATDEIVASVPLVVDWVKIGHEASYYSYSYGVAPQMRYRYDDQLSINLAGSLSTKDYQSNENRGGNNFVVSTGLTYQFDSKSYLLAGITRGDVNSGIDYYSNDNLGAYLGYGYRFANGLSTSARVNYRDTEYLGIQNAYDKARQDTTSTVSLSAAYPIKPLGFDVVLSASYTDNSSNLSLYEYDRLQGAVTLQTKF